MKGHFGVYGGQFVPETLMYPLEELEEAYKSAQTRSCISGTAGVPLPQLLGPADTSV